MVARRVADRQRDTVVVTVQRGHLTCEPNVTVDVHQRIAQPGYELVLWVDVVGPITGQRAVVEHHALLGRAELAAVVRPVEVQEITGDANRLQQLDRAVLNRPSLGEHLHLRSSVTLENDEIDAGALQEMRGHEAGRAGADDRDGRDVVARGRRHDLGR